MLPARWVSVRVPDKVYRRIRRIADEQDVTISTVIVVSLTELATRFQAGEEIALVRR